MAKTIIPNLESLVAGYGNSSEISSSDFPEMISAVEDMSSDNGAIAGSLDYTGSSLWDEFRRVLDKPKGDGVISVAQKTYKIDEDIIETIAQCDFKVPTTTVLNCILRTFIVANIANFRDIRLQRPESLFDKYPEVNSIINE